jgi:spore germination protein KC
MYKRWVSVMIFFILLSSILTGCRDASEVDDNVYAVAIGIDKGVNNKVVLTILYPSYRGAKGGESGDSTVRGSNVHSIEAPSVLEGIDLLNMAISRRVSFLHGKMLVISEDLAREGIGDFLSPIAKFRGTRRTLFVVVCKGSALEFIKANRISAIGGSVTKTIELMLEQSKNTGFFPNTSYHEFYKNILSPYGEASAIYAGVNDTEELDVNLGKREAPLVTQRDFKPGELPRVGTGKREFVGTALFKGDKMVGSFNPYETRYMLMLTNKFEKGFMTIEDEKAPGKAVVLNIRYGRPVQIKGHFDDGKPVIDIALNIEADINSIQSRINYEDLKKVEELNKQLKEEIKEGVEKIIEKTKNEYKTDVFEFGKKFAGYFPTIDEWEKYNWRSHYSEARVNVEVEVNVRRTGHTIDSSPILGESEDE